VSVQPTDGEVMIQIQDTGIGIAPERLTRIFELFSRGEDGDTEGREGLGIGLAVVKGVVERHGGRVEARSAGIGNGATFTVTFPRSQAT
jgi:two-component system CheB/CheR fusion protein